MRTPGLLVYALASSVLALSQNPPRLLDPAYAVGLYVPYEDGGRWGFADTLGRPVVAPRYDSVPLPARGGNVDPNYRLGYRNGEVQVILADPPSVLPEGYDTLAYLFRMQGPDFNTEGWYAVQGAGGVYDLLGPSGGVVVSGATEIVPGSNFGTNVGVLVKRAGVSSYRLYGTSGEPLTASRYGKYVRAKLPIAVEDSLGSARPSVYHALVVSATEYHYIGYQGIWAANPETGAGFRQLVSVDRYGERAIAEGRLTRAEVDRITGPPPPPPASPAPPQLDYAEGEVPVLRRYLNRGRRQERAAQQPRPSYDTTAALEGLGVDSLGRTYIEELVRGRYLPALQLAYLPDGVSVLDRADGRLFDIRLDTVRDVVMHYVGEGGRGVGREAVYYVSGHRDGQAQLLTDTGEMVLTESFERIAYDYNLGYFKVYRNGKVGIYRIGSRYGVIEPNYDRVGEVLRMPVHEGRQFQLFEVSDRGQPFYVGENGVEFRAAR